LTFLSVGKRWIPIAVLAMGTVSGAATPTWNGEVQGLLERKCMECHRAGESAPMAFTSFKDARPWAKAIRKAVEAKRMPPWFADTAQGHFRNDRSLTAGEREMLLRWVDGGAPEGKPVAGRQAATFAAGWNIGQPDQVLSVCRSADGFHGRQMGGSN
jgi:hypothetical protein